jgi:Fe-S-cluster containining protein
MYDNIERYFNACDHCGDCCALPGIFLPEQIGLLSNHLNMDREQLFRKYLIAELFTPHVDMVPCFVISPVKTASNGLRENKLLSDSDYAHIRHGQCVFRDGAGRSCRVHEHKPFGCTLLICGKMTMAKPIMLNKTYYYHRWLGSQAILFSIFPELGTLYERLLAIVSKPPKKGKDRSAAFRKANSIIGTEMAAIMNGHSSPDKPFYRGTEELPEIIIALSE